MFFVESCASQASYGAKGFVAYSVFVCDYDFDLYLWFVMKWMCSVQWFPDGESFVSGSDDASCRLFDLRSHRQLNKYSDDSIYGSITSVDVTKSGYYMFAGYDEDPFCIAWNVITGELEDTLDHPTRCSCLMMSPDGYGLATGCWDKQLRVWA